MQICDISLRRGSDTLENLTWLHLVCWEREQIITQDGQRDLWASIEHIPRNFSITDSFPFTACHYSGFWLQKTEKKMKLAKQKGEFSAWKNWEREFQGGSLRDTGVANNTEISLSLSLSVSCLFLIRLEMNHKTLSLEVASLTFQNLWAMQGFWE